MSVTVLPIFSFSFLSLRHPSFLRALTNVPVFLIDLVLRAGTKKGEVLCSAVPTPSASFTDHIPVVSQSVHRCALCACGVKKKGVGADTRDL